MEVHVLTTGYWPVQASIPCHNAPIFQQCNHIFTNFYLDSNSGRKLAWITELGSVEVKVLI